MNVRAPNGAPAERQELSLTSPRGGRLRKVLPSWPHPAGAARHDGA
eukprot:CAMPEP_0203853370 /NCGR_PEP_ID=MMETSP0359-20131031/8497_1 /ASSEMBLY_ACC=CAM_ASM_000338 /TAXON_ID=268821 /ORGANISM="Scrippsiella Hangoei, Strain SHTV-5" /LENGTH=45 /DNA_ID= /DNA_START= /DNA_END= /DNA_ORIENTATION=